MNKLFKIKKLLAFIMCGAITLNLTFAYSEKQEKNVQAKTIAELQEERAENDRQIEQLQKELKKYDASMKEQKDYQDTLNNQIILMQNNISIVDEELNRIKSDISTAEKNITQLVKDIAQQEKDIADNTELFKERLRAMYVTGNDSLASAVIGATDFYDMLSRVEMVNRIAEHDNDLIETLKTQLETLDAQKSALESEKLTLEAKKAEQENKRTEFETLRNEYNTAFEKSEEYLNTLQLEANSKQQDIESLNAINDEKLKEEEKIKAAEEAARKAREEKLAKANEEAIQKAKSAAEKRALEAKAEAERIAREKAEAEKKAKEEAERIAKEKAEAERKEKEAKAEAERIAKEKAEAEKKAEEARKKAEKEAAEKEAKRKAEQEEAERKAAQEAKEEAERLAKEKAEAERKAKEEAERLAAEQAAAEEEQRRAEEEQAEAERLAAEQAAQQAQPSSSGFVWPAPGGYYISSGFGPRWGTTHKGIDIAGGGIGGTAAVASRAGTVIMVNNSCTHDYGKDYSCGCGGGYGNYVLIDHGDGYSTMYAHLSTAYVSVGENVEQGQSIGAVGSTGYSTGDHLHFEVRIDGTRYDPEDYLN